MLTGEQIRAARALARIEQAQLARSSGLSLETIKRLERIHGWVEANTRTLNAIISAFEEIGIRLDSCEDGGVGVCRPPLNLPAPASRTPRTGRAPNTAEPIHRLIYFSTVAPPLGESLKRTLDDISRAAIRRNPEQGVTGVLMACNGRFLQVLEGAKDAVHQIYGAISADPRHYGLQMVESRPISSRQFSDWGLCCGIFPSDDQLFHHEPAMTEGFHPERLTPASAFGLLCIVRDLERSAPRSLRRDRGGCRLAADCLDQACAVGSA
jgi:DNA-binding XRE family transcriptional regulator